MKDCAVIISIFLVFTICLYVGIEKIESNLPVMNAENFSNSNCLIILDAGHGGEDSGAVAFDGTYEKDINLEICYNISLFFDIFAIDYISIRTDDISVGDISLPTIRERKNSDILTRYKIINSYENSVLLSIHQNMFQVEKYFGTQVFYSANVPESELIAKCIQDSVVSSLQPDNYRKIKSASKNIYLLHKAQRPSVMVECGFLSNFNELSLLKTNEYRAQISYSITKGILNYLNQKRVI